MNNREASSEKPSGANPTTLPFSIRLRRQLSKHVLTTDPKSHYHSLPCQPESIHMVVRVWRKSGNDKRCNKNPADTQANSNQEESMPPWIWEQKERRAKQQTSVTLPPVPGNPVIPDMLARDEQLVTTQAVTYIRSLFVPGKVRGSSFSLLVNPAFTYSR